MSRLICGLPCLFLSGFIFGRYACLVHDCESSLLGACWVVCVEMCPWYHMQFGKDICLLRGGFVPVCVSVCDPGAPPVGVSAGLCVLCFYTGEDVVCMLLNVGYCGLGTWDGVCWYGYGVYWVFVCWEEESGPENVW